MGGTLVKVNIGHGRGWLAPAPAASLRRIDAQLGRPADINEAGRSPEQADENRRKWLAYERYLNGGPWAPKAPYALGSDQSVHCWGYAADSDDWYNARAAAVWRENGWRQTARYPGNKAKDEPWHGEYFEHLDVHRFDGTPAGGASTTPATLPEESEEDEMRFLFVKDSVDGNGVPGWVLLNSASKNPKPFLIIRADEKDAQKRADGWATVWGNARPVTRQEFMNALDAIKQTS